MSLPARARRIPDILECLAQLSNDQVATPPDLANDMLDLLPEAVWSDPTLRWLDPSVKSGVFLREAARRLMVGLEGWEPDSAARREHIFTKMLFGYPTIELTALIGRRSLYYTTDASSERAVVRFPTHEGNLPLREAQHTFVKGRCVICRAAQSIERGENREDHAYAFIHQEREDMQFDVIVGNPPFQLDDGGHGASAAPMYHRFVEMAIDMNPKYVLMITPSRWMAGGKYLDDYRERMMHDHRLRNIVDYPKLYDGFPGVKIRGGVSYFLWDRDYDGPCTFQTMWDRKPVGEAVARYLDTYDVIVRRNEAITILDKVLAKGEPTLRERVSAGKPFGLRTNFHGKKTDAGLANPVKFYGSQKVTWVERSALMQNDAWVDDWKVLMSAVQGTSAAVETQFLGKPIIAGPGTACSETYLVAGRFDNSAEAMWYAAYLRTRFARFMVSLRKSTQHANRGVYGFVPDVPLDREWTDEALYERYGLNEEEIGFIESQVREMPAVLVEVEG